MDKTSIVDFMLGDDWWLMICIAILLLLDCSVVGDVIDHMNDISWAYFNDDWISWRKLLISSYYYLLLKILIFLLPQQPNDVLLQHRDKLLGHSMKRFSGSWIHSRRFGGINNLSPHCRSLLFWIITEWVHVCGVCAANTGTYKNHFQTCHGCISEQ